MKIKPQIKPALTVKMKESQGTDDAILANDGIKNETTVNK